MKLISLDIYQLEKLVRVFPTFTFVFIGLKNSNYHHKSKNHQSEQQHCTNNRYLLTCNWQVLGWLPQLQFHVSTNAKGKEKWVFTYYAHRNKLLTHTKQYFIKAVNGSNKCHYKLTLFLSPSLILQKLLLLYVSSYNHNWILFQQQIYLLELETYIFW